MTSFVYYHGILESIMSVLFREEYNLGDKPIIALLPGSRKQEITKMLSVMLSIIDDYPYYKFVIGGAPSQDFSFYQNYINFLNLLFLFDNIEKNHLSNRLIYVLLHQYRKEQ